jgi:hypothetical protein
VEYIKKDPWGVTTPEEAQVKNQVTQCLNILRNSKLDLREITSFGEGFLDKVNEREEFLRKINVLQQNSLYNDHNSN